MKEGTIGRAASFLFILSFLCYQSYCAYSILDYGGIPNVNTNQAAWTNSVALTAALLAANNSLTSDRTALIPSNYSFYIFEVEVSQMYNITIEIDGILLISNNITAWPTSNPKHTLAALYISDSEYITMQGKGTFDGQGYDWWVYVFETTIDNRPMMICMNRVSNLLIHEIYFKNSPQYHLDLRELENVIIRNITIHVDVEKQKELYRKYDLLNEFGIPVFPLNTDGIDPQGKNFLIENVTIENFDDAIAVKPQTQVELYAPCSQDMVIRNSIVNFSVGLSIGSVPPNTNVNCIKNITFDNIQMHHPIKGIYIKTNPGDEGSGIIDGITYSNIHIRGSLWYPIWIGPQQQRQPGTPGNGCSFFYPIIDVCPTQPLVPISNVKLINVTLAEGVFLPGVILCNETNPCSNFLFENVRNTGFFIVQNDYVCQNVQGTVINSNPNPGCFVSAPSTSGAIQLPADWEALSDNSDFPIIYQNEDKLRQEEPPMDWFNKNS